jgi:hypothetical protein
MVEIIWTETSLLNIDKIAEYISQDSVFYAQILVDKFFKIEKELMTSTFWQNDSRGWL